MKKFKDNMLLQILLGAVILIVFIIVLAQFTNTSSQEENMNTFRNESENTTIDQGQTIENEDNENQDTETNEIEDITDSVKNDERWYYGYIMQISEEEIQFQDEGKNRKTQIDENTKYINARTGAGMAFEDIKIGDYLHVEEYDGEYHVYVARNIQGEELQKELLQNMAQDNGNIVVNTLSFESVEKINTDKAIVTLTYGDTYWDIFDNDEQFEIKAIVNSDTKILSKSNLSNSIDTIENSKHDMIMIDLDSDTIYDENPVITVYESSDN